MNFFSNFIMSKRKRELPDIIIVLRGVPGTGKTTTAHQLYDLFKVDYDYYVEIISRDTKRLAHCKKHGIDYQTSFRDPAFNTHVRDVFYEDLYDHLVHYRNHVKVPTVTIIDATNTKLSDIKHTLWTIRRTNFSKCKQTDVYIYTKRTEHGSTHGVPECIMTRFREELKQSDEWLKANSHDYNFKIVNKVSYK